jgi:hypothetical protein
MDLPFASILNPKILESLPLTGASQYRLLQLTPTIKMKPINP